MVDASGPARSGWSLRVEGERIAAVGPDASLSPRPEERVVELKGRTLMPGLASCHFHATFDDWGSSPAPALGLERKPAAMAFAAARNVRKALDSGVTSIIGASGPFNIDAAVRDEILWGRVLGPRMLAGSHELGTTGDAVDLSTRNWHYQLGESGTARIVDGVAAFQKAVREEIGWGADIVKVAASNGHGLAPASEPASITFDELQAAAEAAHGRSRKIRAHAASRISVLNCARAGFDIIDHADRADAECHDAILEAGSYVVPSLLFSQRFKSIVDAVSLDQVHTLPLGSGTDIEAPGDTRKRFEGILADYEYACRNVQEMHRAGIPLLTGDDFGTAILPHGDYAKELSFYVKEIGIPAMEVLRWATQNAADFMDLGEEAGSVEAGKYADLLVVDGDPLGDISCLEDAERIHAILVGGAFAKDALAGDAV